MYPKINILLVDDEEELAIALQHMLQLEGYLADYTTSARRALEYLQEKKYHIVIADIVMPEMDGVELLTEIKKYDSLTQVIMMTGFSTMDRTVKCLELGASDYLLKPFQDLSRVVEAVRLSEVKLRRWWDSMRGNFA